VATLRQAQREDIPSMHRMAVRENRLRSSVINEQHYLPAIETAGRGWVVETYIHVLVDRWRMRCVA
jgi:hypothetical protein